MTQPTSYFLAWRAKWKLTLPNARAQGDMAPRSAQAQHLWGKPHPSLQQVAGTPLAVGVRKCTRQHVSS